MSIIQSTLLLSLTLGICFCQRCGLSGNSTRIVGGQPSGVHERPWMALLKITFRSATAIKTSQCGGTLISDQWILTAAHCVHSTSTNRLQSIEVTLGEHDTNKREGSELKLYGRQVYEDNFDESTNANDIALIRLSRRVDLNNNGYIQPICLPRSESGIDKNRCFATGWGRTSEDGRSSTVLREVRLPLLDDTVCQSTWGRLYRSQSQVCAGYREGGRDTCQGDSGGPLSCQLANGVWVQEGITSYGNGCATGTPGVYTQVSAYLPWIERVFRSSS